MHGPTFMGNPLACAIANQSIKLLQETGWEAKVKNIQNVLIKELPPASQSHRVSDVRVLGAIGVIQMNHQINPSRAQSFFVKHGVWARPFGKLLYIMPPYTISDEDLRLICQVMIKFTNTKS